EKDIQNIQRFGQPLFTDAEQTQIAQEARAKALEEVTREVEGTTTPAAAATGTQATTPGQGAAAAGTTVSLVPPNLMPPGSVDGKYYTNDPRVIAMLTSMGYGTGTAADIKRFQS
ncbi:MAG: hypothetical protein NT001_02485, partial [Candidatus Woesearchaeota archaeon]|nr:hypothetical protein [Candidatus Woesearchaeota archaeon]